MRPRRFDGFATHISNRKSGVSLLPQNQHRATRRTDHMLSDRPKQQSLHATATMRRHHDQLDRMFLRSWFDRCRR